MVDYFEVGQKVGSALGVLLLFWLGYWFFKKAQTEKQEDLEKEEEWKKKHQSKKE